jgi:hypothetical protein
VKGNLVRRLQKSSARVGLLQSQLSLADLLQATRSEPYEIQHLLRIRLKLCTLTRFARHRFGSTANSRPVFRGIAGRLGRQSANSGQDLIRIRSKSSWDSNTNAGNFQTVRIVYVRL